MMTFLDNCIRFFWKPIQFLYRLRIFRKWNREPYFLGWLAHGRSADDLKTHLERCGFECTYIAWVDPGEILGMRLKNGFKYQFHLRLYKDGEIRGHHELTHEYSPLGHALETDMTPQREKFLAILENLIEVPPTGHPHQEAVSTAQVAASGKIESRSAPAASLETPENG